ncbi:MAG TPA: hypothetical protein VFU29_24465 [Chitinophagaceae bacterium]|nr:hypothetical protein [Chitinophagaceae bacterium]
MKDINYWKRYPVLTDPDKISQAMNIETFSSSGKLYELLSFAGEKDSPCIIIAPGSGGHAFVFAELAYLIHKKGYNAFIMPKQGGFTINELLVRHEDAVNYLRSKYKTDLHFYGEGLGGLVVFYLGLKGIELKSIICENSPAILTEPAFHKAMKKDGRAGKRRAILLPFFKLLVKIFPSLPVPIRAYLAWHEIIDTDQRNNEIEKKMVYAYDHDPDFDKWYPLKAVMSLLNTKPPVSVDKLSIPTFFILATRGLIPNYFRDLFLRLGARNKKLEEIDGGAFWMVSNPDKSSEAIINWIKQINKKS